MLDIVATIWMFPKIRVYTPKWMVYNCGVFIFDISFLAFSFILLSLSFILIFPRIKGDIEDIERSNGRTCVIVDEGVNMVRNPRVPMAIRRLLSWNFSVDS